MSKFTFGKNVKAVADERLNNGTIKNLWKSFCLTAGEIEFSNGAELTFVIGNTAVPRLSDGKEYSVHADENGAAVIGKDYGGLVRGVIALMMNIESISLADGEELFAVRCFDEESNYSIQNRMIHVCLFPEDDLYFIRKVARLAGLCQYTHIVLEFWGMLRYDCLKELSWPNAFSKDEIRLLIKEIRELGMEPIPMINHFGHATQSRVCYGKHVVLDQNPRLQELFTPDGWAWDINSEKVCNLLKTIRSELYELFGDGEYFHIGFDEAYYYTRCDELRQTIPDFLRKLTSEIVSEGRRPLMWMDMLLEKDKFPGCYGVCVKGEDEKLISSLAKETVMVDWQYEIDDAPVESMVHFNKTGYDVIGAPRLRLKNYIAVAETVKTIPLFGIMLTTWHILKTEMPGILGCAKEFGATSFPWSVYSGIREETATLLRRVSFEGNSYRDCGWSKEQVEV